MHTENLSLIAVPSEKSHMLLTHTSPNKIPTVHILQPQNFNESTNAALLCRRFDPRRTVYLMRSSYIPMPTLTWWLHTLLPDPFLHYLLRLKIFREAIPLLPS